MATELFRFTLGPLKPYLLTVVVRLWLLGKTDWTGGGERCSNLRKLRTESRSLCDCVFLAHFSSGISNIENILDVCWRHISDLLVIKPEIWIRLSGRIYHLINFQKPDIPFRKGNIRFCKRKGWFLWFKINLDTGKPHWKEAELKPWNLACHITGRRLTVCSIWSTSRT